MLQVDCVSTFRAAERSEGQRHLHTTYHRTSKAQVRGNQDLLFHTILNMAAEQQQTLLDQTKQTVADLSTKVAETLNVGSNVSVKAKDAPTGGEYRRK